jgi:hypothetical protein
LNKEGCQKCDADPATECSPSDKAGNGEQCYVCGAKKISGCEKVSLMNKDACLSSCKAEGLVCAKGEKTPEGEDCFVCQPEQGDIECRKNGYQMSCVSCSEDEECFEMNVILYGRYGKMPSIKCYECSPK